MTAGKSVVTSGSPPFAHEPLVVMQICSAATTAPAGYGSARSQPSAPTTRRSPPAPGASSRRQDAQPRAHAFNRRHVLAPVVAHSSIRPIPDTRVGGR
jgi:hypothetical protein